MAAIMHWALVLLAVCTNNNSLFQGAIALTILWLDPKTWALVWLFFNYFFFGK